MAFLRKAGGILKQTVGNHINSEVCGAKPSVFQMLRYMSTNAKVFVGGLSYATDDTSLREEFSKYGEVVDARVISDRDTGRSRGFGFVSFVTSEEASAAITALDGQDLQGRRVRVNFANERPRGGGFGYGGNNFGSGGGGYGGGYNQGGGGYGQGGGGYGQGGGGYGQGGGGYGQGGGGYGQGGGSYGQRTDFDSGTLSNFGTENNAVAGGVGGSENFGSGDIGGNNAFGSNPAATATGGFDLDDPNEGNLRDADDEDDEFVKRA